MKPLLAVGAAVLALASLAPAVLAADQAAVARAYQACVDRVNADLGRTTTPSAETMAACQHATAVWDAQGYGYGRDSNFAGIPDPHPLLAPQGAGDASSASSD